MWVDELLFVLMAAALVALAVLVLIVNVKTRNRREASLKNTVPESAPKSRIVVTHEPINLTRPPEPEHEDASIEPLSEPLSPLPPEFSQAPRLDHVFEPTPEPAEPPSEPDPPLYFIEAPQESPPMQVPEPSAPPTHEPVVPPPSIEEPAPPAEEPTPIDLRRETESRFFDLRYDNTPQVVVTSEPSILDGSPSIDYEEEEEEEKEEPPPGIVTCPHCKSKVPQTLYCIYCGNTLAAKPAASK